MHRRFGQGIAARVTPGLIDAAPCGAPGRVVCTPQCRVRGCGAAALGANQGRGGT